MSDEEMNQLLVAVEAQLGEAWVEAVQWLRDQNQLDDVAARVEAGDYEGAVIGVEQAAQRFAEQVADGYITAGKAAAAWLDKNLPDSLVTFSTTNYRAVQWAQQNKLDLVQQITAQQKQVINQVLTDSTRGAVNPRVWARDLRDSIGLTAYQEGHVASYRQALEQGDLANALERELRDGRSDRSIIAAIQEGGSLPQEQIDSMVERYRANYIVFRTEAIARSEGLRVIHQGTQELYEQAIEDGHIEAANLVQQWNSRHDTRTRRSHYVMDGQQRAFGEMFLSGDGVELEYPGDPNAPASETANCRCNRSLRLVKLEAPAPN